MGIISLWADFSAPPLSDSDLISAYFDGIELFTASLGEFHRGLMQNVHLYVKRDLLVRINFNNKRIYVEHNKVDLRSFDPANDVNVEIGMGDATAVETFAMEKQSSLIWLYRPGNE